MVAMFTYEKMYPETPEAISQIIRDAQSKGEGIIPCGKGHLVDKFIASNGKPAKFVSSAKLNAIEDLDVNNLSVKVQAGMTLAELDNAIKEYNLFLPITLESHGHRTLGGLVAEDAAGYEAYTYDSIQNHILGLEFVTPYGSHVKTGGKTVKNVSGYDFTRLFARSWGTLGIITAITFKLRPQLENRTLLLVEVPTIHEAYNLAKQSKATKSSMIALKIYKTGEKNSPWKLAINLGGFIETVKQHLSILQNTCAAYPQQVFADCYSYWSNYYQNIVPDHKQQLTIRSGKNKAWLLADILNQIGNMNKVYFCEIDLGIGEIKIGVPIDHHLELQQQLITLSGNLSLSYDWVKPPIDPVYQKLKAALDPNQIMFPCHKWFGGEHFD